MFRKRFIQAVVFGALFLLLWGCATPFRSMETEKLIDTLRRDSIETLIYSTYPENVRELTLRNDSVFKLISAYDRGGDDLFRFNIIMILNNHSDSTDEDKAAIIQCLYRAVKDSSSWVRTEAVWGLGMLPISRSIPVIIPLLDDPDSNVVNEVILSLTKITNGRYFPMNDLQLSAKARQNAVEYWKDWWCHNSPIEDQGVEVGPVLENEL